jgi:hypothetical protein
LPLYFICDGKHRKGRTPPAAQETAYAAPAAENHQKEPVEEISQAPFDGFQKEIFPLLNLR